MALHINDLIAKGAEEPDLEQVAEHILEEQLGESAGTMVDTWLIIGQLDPLELGKDGKPRWTPEQQKLILAASERLDEYTD